MEKQNLEPSGSGSENIFIAEIPCFKNFSPEEIKILEQNSKLETFKAGEYLLKNNQVAEKFFYLITGTVSLQVHSPEDGIIEIESVQGTDFLGWSWLTPPFQYFFDAVAFKSTKAIVFNSLAIKRAMENNHEFGYKMYQVFTSVLVNRYQGIRKNIVELYEKKF